MKKKKKRAYNSCIMHVEHSTFIPSIFSLTGGEGPEMPMFHKNIARKISAKIGENYDRVLSLMRCKVPFLILRSVLMCVLQ